MKKIFEELVTVSVSDELWDSLSSQEIHAIAAQIENHLALLARPQFTRAIGLAPGSILKENRQ